MLDKDKVWQLVEECHPEMKRDNFPVDDPYMFLEIVVRNCYRFTAKPGMKVLDIGANIGVFTALCALNGAEVVAVEPHPGARDILAETLRRNQIEGKVHVLPVAVATYDGLCDYHGTEDSTSNPQERTWTTYNGSVNNPDVVVVQQTECVSFHELVAYTQWDCVKMDIEGAEFDILIDAPPEAFERIDYLTLELHNGWASREKYDALIEKLEESFTLDGFFEPIVDEGVRYVSIFGTRTR